MPLDTDHDPEITTPTEPAAQTAPADAVCGFPVDRTPPDWPGIPATTPEARAT